MECQPNTENNFVQISIFVYLLTKMKIIPEQEVIPQPQSPISEIMEEPIEEADNMIDTDET